MPFGKYRGKAIKDVPTGYLKWLLLKTDIQFPELTEAAEKELYGRELEAMYERVKKMKKERRRERSIQGRLDMMDEQNRIAAQIVLGNPERYPGVMQEWAERFLSRRKEKQCQKNKSLLLQSMHS